MASMLLTSSPVTLTHVLILPQSMCVRGLKLPPHLHEEGGEGVMFWIIVAQINRDVSHVMVILPVALVVHRPWRIWGVILP